MKRKMIWGVYFIEDDPNAAHPEAIKTLHLCMDPATRFIYIACRKTEKAAYRLSYKLDSKYKKHGGTDVCSWWEDEF